MKFQRAFIGMPLLHEPAEQLQLQEPSFQRWGAHTGTSSTSFHRLRDGGFLIRFPGCADFVISAMGAVECIPTPQSGDDWLGIFEQQVQPLLLSLQGEHVFHGGAVAIGDQAVAFLASSGRGKSTLTTAFARRGYAFLGDDCLHLDLSGPRVQVHPHAAHVRLWEDSASILGGGEAVYVPGSPKPRLVAGDRLPHCDRALPLARVYLLSEDDVDAPVLGTASPYQQLIGWTANAFVLDIKNPEVLKRNLAAAARLVREVPMRRLDYPRRYERLDDVVDAVLADVAG